MPLFEFEFNETEITTESWANCSAIVYNDTMQTSRDEATQKMIKCVDAFTAKISEFKISEKDTNSLFKLCANLVDGMKCFTLDLIDLGSEVSAPEAIDIVSSFVRQHLFKFNSSYKRQKVAQANDLYVFPKEIAIGTRFSSQKKKMGDRIVKIPRLIQATFYYISITETLKSLFKDQEFSKQYFDYQQFLQNEHICVPGKYEFFCCGNAFKNAPLFQQFPDSLQLQIATDDFEVCNALASKANLHKICAVYFSILNLPQSYLSKRKFVFPVVICNADEVKMKHTDFNNIWYPMVNEIKQLEYDGIMVKDKNNFQMPLKGTMAEFASDNLGANVSLGYTASFQCDSYCRHCHCSKLECEAMTREDKNQLRTIESYNNQIDIIANSSTVNFKETKGVKYYCILSDLENFHIVSNPSVDIMHDILEGSIPFALKHVITRCIKANIFSLSDLNSMLQLFDYGLLDRRSIPSEINLNKRSLGQNAGQSMCLFKSLPFILNRYQKNRDFPKIWRCVQPLYRIVEIVFSHVITEADLTSLNEAVHELTSELKAAGVKLIPKLHFHLHYEEIIRAVGPLVYMNMMRYERKHHALKQFVQGSRSFKNINQTIILRHQQNLYNTGYSYTDDFENGIASTPNQIFFNEYGTLLNTAISAENLNRLKELKWFRFNSFDYRQGILVVYQESFYEIQKILFIDNRWIFLCKPRKVISFDPFLYSYKIGISDQENLVLIDLKSLIIFKTYDIFRIGLDSYVKADTLELRTAINFK